MDIISVLLLVVIVYLLVTGRSAINNRFNYIEQRITEMQSLLKQGIRENAAAKTIVPPIFSESKHISEATVAPPAQPEAAPPIIERQKTVITDQPPITKRPVISSLPSRPLYPQREPRLSFFERYPDLEKFIGENLINKIGIAILVLAIGYFVKYAIDNNWIGPVGRVGIGILCGAILIGFAHWLRNGYKAFSSVLAGGGLAIFYFTITLAFHQFHLFNQTTSFIILIMITIFAVVLALLYNKQELAVIALVGGLSSPFMVSNGNANYHALFIYLIILNAGLLVLAYFKAWRVLNISTFVLTVMVYATVIYTLTDASYYIGFIYGSIFYLLFFSINIANNLRQGKSFIAADFGILLANTALYFSAGLYLLTMMHDEQYRGLFCASLGMVNLALSFILFKNQRIDVNVLYLLIGITLTFVSLTAPIQLHGHHITLFWASETVLLYWLYKRSGIALMKITSLLIWIIMLISLMMDWAAIYTDETLPLTIIANKGFITTFFAAISSGLLYYLLKTDAVTNKQYFLSPGKGVYQAAAFILLFLSGLLEINHQFLNHYAGTGLNTLYVTLYAAAFIYLFNKLTQQASKFTIRPEIRLGLIIAIISVFLIFTPPFFDVQRIMLERGKPGLAHFIAHWLGALFILALFYELIDIIRHYFNEELSPMVTWVICAGVVCFLSLEGSLISNLIFYSRAYSVDDVQTVYIKTGLPVLWGLLSFAMMWLGMRFQFRILRIISLSLFTLTLAKLFIFDIRNIPAAGKIAAFFCLGVLLLVVSFMYQKVKKIIADDENRAND